MRLLPVILLALLHVETSHAERDFMCEVVAQKSVHALVVADESFGCHKFGMVILPNKTTKTRMVVEARCPNPKVWTKFSVKIKKQKNNCKVVEVKEISRSRA